MLAPLHGKNTGQRTSHNHEVRKFPRLWLPGTARVVAIASNVATLGTRRAVAVYHSSFRCAVTHITALRDHGDTELDSRESHLVRKGNRSVLKTPDSWLAL